MSASKQSSGLDNEKRLSITQASKSGYGYFVQMCYDAFMRKYPNERVTVEQVADKCTAKWKDLSDNEKHNFLMLAAEDGGERCVSVVANGKVGKSATKRKRAKKDPNAPKRPMTAFLMFAHDKRHEIRTEHPDWKLIEVSKEAGRLWSQASDVLKREYQEKADCERQRYDEAMAEYSKGVYKPRIRKVAKCVLETDMPNSVPEQRSSPDPDQAQDADLGALRGVATVVSQSTSKECNMEYACDSTESLDDVASDDDMDEL